MSASPAQVPLNTAPAHPSIVASQVRQVRHRRRGEGTHDVGPWHDAAERWKADQAQRAAADRGPPQGDVQEPQASGRAPRADPTRRRPQELAKSAKGFGEEGKVAIRNIRRDAIDKIKKLEKVRTRPHTRAPADGPRCAPSHARAWRRRAWARTRARTCKRRCRSRSRSSRARWTRRSHSARRTSVRLRHFAAPWLDPRSPDQPRCARPAAHECGPLRRAVTI